ncbi:MAG: PadR family transcriptional regulator [Actinobacteria bacterium]|nr:PadR family transcriptional regulator [Actinomycetota bacterium]
MHRRDRLYYWRMGPMHGHGAGPFGPGFPGPGDFAFGRARRMRRGNVRAAILLLLAEEPRNGYQLMQELESRSGGAWRPSPGSVYPALQLLADEGLIRAEQRDGGNVYELTDAGRTHLDENREHLGDAPWEQASAGVPDDVRELMRLAMQVGMATRQVTHAGNESQRKEAAELLAETRRALYRILAEQ